jgi:hypothetical protein
MEEELNETERIRRRKAREAAGKPAQLPLQPPVRPTTAPARESVRERRIPEGAKVIKEPLELIQLRREERKRKKEELAQQPSKRSKEPETGAQRMERKRREDTAIYVDKKCGNTWNKSTLSRTRKQKRTKQLGCS